MTSTEPQTPMQNKIYGNVIRSGKEWKICRERRGVYRLWQEWPSIAGMYWQPIRYLTRAEMLAYSE